MTGTRVVVVLGGDPTTRAALTASTVTGAGGTALVLTAHPGAVSALVDTSQDGPVEVRTDDPSSRLEAYRSGAADPDDDVLAALAAGVDTPLAAVLGWEYARRAAAADHWDLVVVELDGDIAAVRRLAAPGALAEFVESRWPAHVRFASMAAGEHADARIREAHRLALLAADVSDFLSGPVEVVVVGGAGDHLAGAAELARGAVTPELTTDAEGGYLARYPVPSEPSEPASVDEDRIRLVVDGLRVSLPLPPVLVRCSLVGSEFEPATGHLVARFLPDPRLWPPNLVPSDPAGVSG